MQIKISTHLPTILLVELSTRDYRRMKKNDLKHFLWSKKPLRCAPCIHMDNIALTLENVEYLYRKYLKQ